MAETIACRREVVDFLLDQGIDVPRSVAPRELGRLLGRRPGVEATAYLGVTGGFIVIAADDPGPHSSQTEQDSRLFAMLAKIPVLDPDSPDQARELVRAKFPPTQPRNPLLLLLIIAPERIVN